MSQYNYLTYYYNICRKIPYYYNCKGRTIRKEQLFPGENILYKCENIDYEDEKNIYIENTNVYFTNFRILILTNENIFDIPYFFMNKIKLSKPLIGSHRIKLYLQKDPILLKINCPYYLKNFFSGKEIYNCSILYPEKITLYFPKEEIDKLFDSILKIHEEQEYSNAPKITLKPSNVPKLEENIENKNYVKYGAGLQGIVAKNKENDKKVRA